MRGDAHGAVEAPYRTLVAEFNRQRGRTARMQGERQRRVHDAWRCFSWLWLVCASAAEAGCGAESWAQTAPDQLQPTQYKAAARSYEEDCEGGSEQACSYLGFMYDNALGVNQDIPRAVALSEHGCTAGIAYGCAYLGYLLQTGRGVTADPARAARLFRKACDGSDASGCLLLGIMYKTGGDVTADAEYAVQLFGRACELGESIACVSLGYMYANGEGVDRNETRAQELFRAACKRDDSIGCQASSQLSQRQPVP
ncbi:MAG: hypothetical protein RL701_992 [Pseudomonadota bacterium]